MSAMSWTKSAGDRWSACLGPFLSKVAPKGDGRWSWQVFRDEADNPTATGIASSLGAAKTAAEQLVRRSGVV
ncbi:MAG: hypothetical protein KF850_32210 [Labilithrix sp.]|nr:hypothetical protein [Labilithrix sp.]